MSNDATGRLRDLGSFIRQQRATAHLSLRRLSELAVTSATQLLNPLFCTASA